MIHKYYKEGEKLELIFDNPSSGESISQMCDAAGHELLEQNEKDGKLYCMTDLYDKSINFHKWYYKNDSTHVFIYHKNTIHWIKEKFGFSNVTIEGRLITFFN